MAACSAGPAARPAPSAAACRPVEGLAPLLTARGGVLIFGEVHGTAESPAFVGDVACAAAAARVPVTLALEVSAAEQGRIDAYLASGGTAEDHAALAAGPFWRRDPADGRSSQAMLRLLETARALRSGGAELAVAAFALDVTDPAATRDHRMADTLAAIARARPRALLLVLTGNLHGRLTRGLPFDTAFMPMGRDLARSLRNRRMLSLEMSHQGGTAWTCRATDEAGEQVVCAAHPFEPGNDPPPAWTVRLDDASGGPFSGTYGVGTITASPPASPPAASR